MRLMWYVVTAFWLGAYVMGTDDQRSSSFRKWIASIITLFALLAALFVITYTGYIGVINL